jgi:hypothetical protein
MVGSCKALAFFNILDVMILAFSCRGFSLPEELQALVFTSRRRDPRKK